MTRYDPHPQDYDDARTIPHGFTGADLSDFQASEAPVGEVAAERLSEPRTVIADDGEGEPTLWVDLGIRGLVPVLRRCDMRPATRHLWPLVPASQVPGVPREALEELADEWRYKGEFGWGPWQTGEGPDQEGWLLDQAATRLRAVLAAHPAGAPGEDPGSRADLVARAAEVLRESPAASPGGKAWALSDAGLLVDPEDVDYQVESWTAARALADAGLLADPEQTARLTEQNAESIRIGQHSSTLYDEAMDEMDEARARVAELEAEVERLEAGGIADVMAERDAAQREQVRLHESRDAAEARARRAEDALRHLRDLAETAQRTDRDVHGSCEGHAVCDLVASAQTYYADQTSDATPSDAGE